MDKKLKSVKMFAGFVLGVVLFFSLPVSEANTVSAAKEYSVTGNMSYLIFSGNNKVTEKQTYSAKISLDGSCQMPSAIDVTVGGVPLAAGPNTYTYNMSTGDITINGAAVTGDIVIVASATLHQWDGKYNIDVMSTCTGQGIQSQHCQICGMASGSTSIAATGHNFANYVSNKDATCFKDGTKTGKCTNPGCNAKNTITDTGSRLAHTVTGKRVDVVMATCMQEGYTGNVVCDVCGSVVARGEKEPVVEHNAILINAKNPSCNIDGYTGDSICRYCDTILVEGEVIPGITEHTYGEWETILEATDFKIGRRERVCTLCGIKESELIASSEFGKVILPVCIAVFLVISGIIAAILIISSIKRMRAAENPIIDNAEDDKETLANEALRDTEKDNGLDIANKNVTTASAETKAEALANKSEPEA